MRIVRIRVPAGLGTRVAETAFASGVREVCTRSEILMRKGGDVTAAEVVDFDLSTPEAREAVEAIIGADYFDCQTCAIAVRGARSLVGAQTFRELTRPIPEPGTDVAQELWQFSHVTIGLCVRTLVAASLLSFGLLKEELLLIIAGLMFIPMLPIVSGVAFGFVARQYDLMRNSLVAFCLVFLAIALTGFCVGAAAGGPINHMLRETTASGILFSLAVGFASAFGYSDDAGRREMLGIAAASQLALLPCWIGLVLGVGEDVEIAPRATSAILNPLALCIAASAGYYFLRYHHEPQRRGVAPAEPGKKSHAIAHGDLPSPSRSHS